jgi:nicotinate phosphoribosyltransferase
VGTELATSADAPNLGAVYKLVELESGGVKRYTAKFSEDKATFPGAKQIFRFRSHDELAGAWECRDSTAEEPVESLQRPVMLGGKLIEPLPCAEQARDLAAKALKKLPEDVRRLEDPEPYRVEYSAQLLALFEQARKNMAGAPV